MKCFRFFLFVLIILLFTGCTKEASEHNINIIKVSDCKECAQKVFYGSVKSQLQSELSFQIEGKIEFIPYVKGDFVKKGTVLARLDGILYKIRKNEESARLKDNILQLNKSKSYYKRMDILHQKGAISDNDWEDAYYGYETNKQLVAIQKEKIRYLEKEINYNIITSPYDGYIVEKLADVGSYAKIGSPVLVINGNNYSQVEILVDSKTVNELDLDKPVTVERNGVKYQGKIKHISSSSKGQGGYLVKINLDKLYNDLKEGMSVTVAIKNKEEPIFKIPLNSIVEKDNENYVYKIKNIKNNKGTAELEKVMIDSINNEEIEVTKGLKNGDLIIENSNSITSGTKVKL